MGSTRQETLDADKMQRETAAAQKVLNILSGDESYGYLCMQFPGASGAHTRWITNIKMPDSDDASEFAKQIMGIATTLQFREAIRFAMPLPASLTEAFNAVPANQSSNLSPEELVPEDLELLKCAKMIGVYVDTPFPNHMPKLPEA